MAKQRPSKKGRVRKRAHQQAKSRQAGDQHKQDLLERFRSKQRSQNSGTSD